MAFPEGTREAIFIAEILADTAANSWQAGGTELPATDVDEELLQLLGTLEGDLAEFTDCLQQAAAQSSAKKSMTVALKTRLEAGEAEARDGSLDVFSEHNTESIKKLFEEQLAVAQEKATEKADTKALLHGVDSSVASITSCQKQVNARVHGAGSEEDIMLDGATGVLDADFQCGITGGDMVAPLVAPCGHVFSTQGFGNHFSGNPDAPKKCPASGCSARYLAEELVVDARTGALMKHSRDLHIKRRAHADDDIEDSSDDEFVPAAGAEQPIKKEPARK